MNVPAAPPAPPARRPPHACFSGNPSCSGCNPCPPCKGAQRECVLPVAIKSSGLADLAGVFFDLVNACLARGIDPAVHLGVQIPAALRSNDEMATALFQGFERGYASLHQRMGQGGDLAGQFRLTPMEPQPVPQPAQASPNPAPAVPAAARVAPVTAPAPAPVSRTAETEVPPVTPAAAAPPPALPPLEAEDIARMVAIPAPAEPLPLNGLNGTPR